MYVYELARELGAEPRELIERAAADEMGHFSPNTKLSQEQLLQLRESYVKATSQSRGSLFAGGARPTPPPPSAMPSAPPPPEASPADNAGSYESPLLRPIFDPDEAAGGEWGGPLAFDPTGTAPPPTSPSAASAPLVPSHLRDEPSWDQPSTGPSPGAAPQGQRSLIDYSGAPSSAEGRSFTETDYERQFRPDDWVAPKPETSSTTRTIAVGVVGLIIVIMASMFAGRQLGIIGPGSERNCMISQSPVADGEGVEEEVVCVDGHGKEISREIRRPDEGARFIEFGSTAEGEPTRVVEMEEFCRGASDFADFRSGFQAELAGATSMVAVGAWYDENDGFGTAGHAGMVGSFGRAGPNPRVVELANYLGDVREAARSRSVDQAQMLFAAAEQTYGDHMLEVQNFANGNC